MDRVLQQVILFYKHEGKEYDVGRLSKVLKDDMSTVYLFDIDKEKMDETAKLDINLTMDTIPGLNFDFGYRNNLDAYPSL